MSRFEEGDRVYHRGLKMTGTYLGQHNWGAVEETSYVLFDNDPDSAYADDGRPNITTALLDPVPAGN